MTHQLVYPITFYVCALFGLLIWNFFKRVNAVKTKRVSGKYFKTYSDKTSMSEDLIILERHVDNQFQLPVIFMVTCTAYMALDKANSITVILAWAFVFLRLGHSYIHLGSNNVYLRASIYALGWMPVLTMWLTLAVRA